MNKAKTKAMIKELKKELSRKNLSEDEIRELAETFRSCFDHMTNVQRSTTIKRFWHLGYEIYRIDQSTNCVYSSWPLLRAFTISHRHLIRQDKKLLDAPSELAEAVEELKCGIASVIKKRRGVVKPDDEPELGYLERQSPTDHFMGFQPGHASDDYLIGRFFSEIDRQHAIEEVIEKWGAWGVRTEPLDNEESLHQLRGCLWRRVFDRKKFRREFAKLSHEERLNAIDDLESKGLDFRFTDPKSRKVYTSWWNRLGSVRYSRRNFEYNFDLGYLSDDEDYNPIGQPKVLPSASDRRKEVDEIERTLLHLIQEHNGFVLMIERYVNEPCKTLEESENFLGTGSILAQFPDESFRRQASKEIHDRLAVSGVRFGVDDDEHLSVDEQIANVHDEREQKREELDCEWERLECRKQSYQEEALAIAEDEERLQNKELRHKEFEKEITERLQQLSKQRDSETRSQ